MAGADEGCLFHNRLTHTLETAQIARRLAEKFLSQQGELAANFGGIDPDVVEAAALAHDLGHAPFGHAGETALNQAALARDLEDGFEGNAQSFRILTRLAAHRANYKGLNLTRATLRAVMKYPWVKTDDPTDSKRSRKYSVYNSDTADFEWAIGGSEGGRSIEAEIMDLADDIAYSVHDLDDFIRGGLVSIELFRLPEFRERFLEEWKVWATETKRLDPAVIEANKAVVENWIQIIGTTAGDGSFRDRAAWKEYSAGMIGRLISNATLQNADSQGRRVGISEENRFLLKFSQRIVWQFIIESPRLASQQHGQRRVLQELVTIYMSAIGSDQQADRNILPRRFLVELEEPRTNKDALRLAIDIVASFTDAQALKVFGRLAGSDGGSLTDLVGI